jgi:hypothetical protein
MLSRESAYQKRPDEDLISILRGIMQPKGRIHLSVGKPLNQYLEQAGHEGSYNKKIIPLADQIDAEIYSHYKCWPNNYIAFDLLSDTPEYRDFYSKEEEELFLGYRESELKELNWDGITARDIFMRMYANPVINLKRIK